MDLGYFAGAPNFSRATEHGLSLFFAYADPTGFGRMVTRNAGGERRFPKEMAPVP